jgi:hypothetical protein
LNKRVAKAQESGKAPHGRAPVPPREGAADKDQINLTDEKSHIMKTAGGGFDRCYNAQLAVDMQSYLITNTQVVQATNDKQQVEPMLAALVALPRLAAGATEVEKMCHLLKTKQDKETYAKRKSTVEPVIGIVKSVLGFRQFLLRGLEIVKGEWDLVALAWNVKRMFNMKSEIPA